MGIYKHPDSSYWYYTFTLNGKRITGSTKTANKTIAQKIYEARRIDCIRGRFGLEEAQRTSFEKLTQEFLTWSRASKKSYKRDVVLVRHLTEFFGKKAISDIAGLDVEKYKVQRKEQVSGSTVNREVACLKRMFNLGIEWGFTHENPIQKVKLFREPKRSFRWWTQDEINRFLAACDDRLRSIASVGINTGLRIGELLGLKWSQIDFESKYITIEESKANTYRKVRMNEIVIDVIKNIPRKDNSEHVFAHADGQPYQSIYKAFRSACKRAGITSSTPHVMRHTFASHLAMLGVDPHTIMELGGWKSLDMVLRYSHLAPDHKQRAVEKLSGLLKNCLSPKNPS